MNYYETPVLLSQFPAFIKRPLRRWHRHYVLGRAVTRLHKLAVGERPARGLVEDLIYGWGNEGMSAGPEYLGETVVQAEATSGHVLECGSGLTTLVLGLIATRRKRQVVSLEDCAGYAKLVRTRLAKHNAAAGVHVVDAPLVDYGAFTWYEMAAAPPLRFSLVICDGPSPVCPTGRYGLVPVVRNRLEPGCVIVLDDVETEINSHIVRRWAAELRVEPQVLGRDKPFAVMRIP